MNHARISRISTLLLFTWFGLSGNLSRAEILVNGVSQGNQATIQNGDSITGNGPSAGVALNGSDDQLSVLGGLVDVAGAGSVGIRVFDGSVTMSGGGVRGVEAGVLVQGGEFDLRGGNVSNGIQVRDAGSLFAMSGGTISNRNVVASSGGAISISGGIVNNSRVQAVGASSRVDLTRGAISWLDAIDGGAAHVYGTNFTVNNTPVDFAGADEFVLPSTAGHMAATYASQATGSFKVVQSTGGTITLHLLTRGDFDADSDLDGADFLSWQRGELYNPLSASDLAAWQANYGTGGSLAAASAAAPEPSPWIMSLLGIIAWVFRMRARA